MSISGAALMRVTLDTPFFGHLYAPSIGARGNGKNAEAGIVPMISAYLLETEYTVKTKDRGTLFYRCTQNCTQEVFRSSLRRNLGILLKP